MPGGLPPQLLAEAAQKVAAVGLLVSLSRGEAAQRPEEVVDGFPQVLFDDWVAGGLGVPALVRAPAGGYVVCAGYARNYGVGDRVYQDPSNNSYGRLSGFPGLVFQVPATGRFYLFDSDLLTLAAGSGRVVLYSVRDRAAALAMGAQVAQAHATPRRTLTLRRSLAQSTTTAVLDVDYAGPGPNRNTEDGYLWADLRLISGPAGAWARAPLSTSDLQALTVGEALWHRYYGGDVWVTTDAPVGTYLVEISVALPR